jgi:Ca2+-binding RTX toxin-like protein
LDATLTKAGIGTWTYDPTRDLLYIITSDGALSAWNVSTGVYQFTRPAVGGEPVASDISPDGRYLFVADGSSTYLGNETNEDRIYRIDLGSFEVTRFAFNVHYPDWAVRDIAVDADNRVLFSLASSWSGGSNELLWFAADTAPGDFHPSLVARIAPGAYLMPSEDHRLIYITEPNGSGGGMDVFSSAAGKLTAFTWLGHFGVPAFQDGPGDVSSAAGLVADAGSGVVYIFDAQLNPVKDLSGMFGYHLIPNLEFNEGGKQLFVWDDTAEQIVVLDTTTWQRVATLPAPSHHDFGPRFQEWGVMDVISGGRVLVIDNDTSLKLIDLTTSLHIELPGTAGADVMNGAIGRDTLDGGAGDDSIFAGGGDDRILGGEGANYLRGDDGNDVVLGGVGFDDINGNRGNDTGSGGLGDDWVVGGKDDDLLNGEGGDDIVYGNLDNDWCDGGEGADLIRGGQGDDVLLGQGGNDWLSGDRGNDTLTGGEGADVFHTFGEAGIDRVTDFSVAQGDRVQLDPGTTYTVSQVGADTVIAMTGGGRMILVGVQLSSLPGGWIFGA